MAAASANEYFELPCDGNSSTCLDSLLDVMPELQYVEVPDDGDCFFHSIAAYYKRTGGIIIDRDTYFPVNVDPTNPRELRSYIVKEFIKLVVAKEPPYPELITGILIENRTNKSLKQLNKSGAWAMNTFDTMINAVPTILMIHLNIYVVNQSQLHQGHVITKAVYQPKQPELLNERGLPTINLFLSGNHYGLLYPVGGENIRTEAQMNANTRKLNTYKAKKAKEYEAQVRLAKKYEGINSNNNSNTNMAELKRKLAAAEARAKAKAKSKSKSKAPLNHNFNKAIASLRNVSHKNVNNNHISALEVSFSNISFSSRNNRNKLAQQNALNASHRISVKRKPRVASKKVDLCKGMIKEEILSILLSMGVENVSMDMPKDHLCAIYKSLTE